MADDREVAIRRLRQRHAQASIEGTIGTIRLLRQIHAERAEGEDRLRKKGYKLHVIQQPLKTNYCRYMGQDRSLVTCLSKSANPTDELCFKCPQPNEWAKKGGHFQQVATWPADMWQPKMYVTYNNGALEQIAREQHLYSQVEFPDGDTYFFKLYTDGLVSFDQDSRLDKGLAARQLAPSLKALGPQEIERRATAAERHRRSRLMGSK